MPPPPPPFPPLVRVPPARRADLGLKVALAVLLVLAACCGTADAGLVALRAHLRAQAGTAYFFGDRDARTAMLDALLQRRATAVARHDEAGFLADVDPYDPSFLRRERDEYQNLLSLDLSSFAMTVTAIGEYPVPAAAAVVQRRYGGSVWTVSVTVRYAVKGLDTAPVAEPWVPIFGFAGGHWLLAGESDEDDLPTGAGGLPWEAKPIVVKRTNHVVAVVSADEQEIAPHLLSLAERGLTQVFKLRPTGWAGKVLVTAVSDRNVFQSYFRDTPDKTSEVAAIAVPTYDAVQEWAPGAAFVTTRVVFNPQTLGDGDEALVHDLAHEFTHAALGPLTSRDTPIWLVEGTAEYVGYNTGPVDDVAVGGVLRRIGIPGLLPDDAGFYDKADNYLVAWLACRLIAQRYSQAKLIALYGFFHDGGSVSVDNGLRSTLGLSLDQFTAAWRSYLQGLAA
ncbi:MAG TPA: hypothetical protein VJT31_11245 [Rugosimonospora sp.]|nr:hypothetical protein [Rugosimonospora sp.]